jgi:hypothetical protein
VFVKAKAAFIFVGVVTLDARMLQDGLNLFEGCRGGREESQKEEWK